MAVIEDIKKRPLSLGESYDLARSGIGVYSALDPGDKQLWIWGYNSHGELADCTRSRRSSPHQVPGTNWNNVSMGNHHVLATKQDGTGWAWGYNNHNQLGNCGCTHQSSPVQLPGCNWCFMSASDCTSFGMKTDGTLWAWGHNNWGQLGLTDACCGWDGGVGCCRCRYQCPTQLPGNTWKCVKATRNSAAGIKCDGTLWVWGHAAHGQLGLCCITCQYPGTCCSPNCMNTSTGCYYPCCSCCTCCNPCFSSPTQIPGTNWTGIEIGCHNMYGIKTDGTLWAWGHGAHGAPGNNQSNDVMCPVQITGSNWVEVNAMAHGAHARKNDNSMWGWGYNSHCEIGDGSNTHRSTPVQVYSSKTWIKLGRNSFSGYSGMAFDNECAMWMWGHNDYGQLGICCTSRMCCPVQVGPDCGWVCGSTSRHATAAVRCFS